jgi:alpha-D-ribose 1-methylphosphonate 5-triphosphate diphosphatase
MSEVEIEVHIAAQKASSAQHGPVHEAAAARRYGAVPAAHGVTEAARVVPSAERCGLFAALRTTAEAGQACNGLRVKVMMGTPNRVPGGSHSGNVAASDHAKARASGHHLVRQCAVAAVVGGADVGDLWGNVARGVATVMSAKAEAGGCRADTVQVAWIGPGNGAASGSAGQVRSFAARAASRICDRVCRGVRASAEMTRSSTAPVRLARARAKAAGKSSVRSTRSA